MTPHASEPLHLLAEIPASLMDANPEVVLISALALLILFGLPMIPHPWAKKIPAPMLVILVAVPLALAFDFEHVHTYTLAVTHRTYEIAPRLLVTVPNSLLGAIAFPDWSAVTSGASIRYVVMFTLVGSIESLLSARAIDQLDTQRLKSDYDRDLLAVGVGNTIAGAIGGLPMIAEIVRSKANLDAGARSRFANLSHGVFLLVFVAFAPQLVHRVPLAALAAMLVHTGTRLAAPSELVKTWKIGREQLVVFVVTAAGCVAVDLLVGVFLGIATKLAIQLVLGARVGTLLDVAVDEKTEDSRTVLVVRSNATFTNYLRLKGRILAAAAKGPVVIDVSSAPLVDHTTMERLRDLQGELGHEGRSLQIVGVERLKRLSEHPMAARRSIAPPPG